MTRVENPEHCYVCGRPLSDEYESIKLPGTLRLGAPVLAGSGVVELRFCCERHRQDWAEKHHGQWKSGADSE